MKKMGMGKSHSKIILMGEHSVVYGYPALALPLKSIKVTCRIFPARKALENRGDALSKALFVALEHLGQEEAPLHFKVQSQIPSKRGMGSSAAVSIAAIRAVFDYFQAPLSEELLEELVQEAEQIAHLNPSGIDAKTCMSQDAIRFIKDQGFEKVPLNLDAYLVIADSGVFGQTKEAVKKVAQLGSEKEPHLEALGSLCQEAEVAILAQDLPALGQKMNQAHQHLQALGVSHDLVDGLVDLAKKKGALGAKMTGGGLGGCMLALVTSKDAAKSVAYHLRKKGAVRTWIEKLSV